MIGTTLAAAALAVLFTAVREKVQNSDEKIALPLLILVLGVQLLIYTEGSNSSTPHGTNSHNPGRLGQMN
jgi:hypothetical protein